MPALLRYFSDLIHFKTSNPNPIPLHGNPILDNFVFKHAAVQTGRTFASAHSCGLRQWDDARSCAVLTLPQRIRAGCDKTAGLSANEYMLCLSAFVRVATQEIYAKSVPIELCLSAFARVATPSQRLHSRIVHFASAHSRGLRLHPSATDTATCFFATAHSRGLRLHRPHSWSWSASFATAYSCGLRHVPEGFFAELLRLCHSAFVRVATRKATRTRQNTSTLPQRIRAGCDYYIIKEIHTVKPLPQRIRAGCDCGKAMQRTANLLREGR